MSVTITTKRLFDHVGDHVVITDIDITQRIVPATVMFDDLLAEIEVDAGAWMVSIVYEGYETDGIYDGPEDVEAAKVQLAKEVADLLEADGIIVTGRPAE
jgi:hypothetical protein